MSEAPRGQGRAPERTDEVILDVEDLATHFPVRKGVLSRPCGWVKAVDGVSFRVRRGKTLGLVGESGCGKTTVGRTILRLIPATRGRVRFDGTDLFSLAAGEMRAIRRQMQIIFQDPVGSLNPRMTVGSIVGEALSVHRLAKGKQRRDRVCSLLDRVGLAAEHVNRYPHEFSGGQRQRIGIARALALNPKFIVCDEPVSALDVSIQSQILNLLADLKEDMNLSYLFIAHNLAVVEHISDDVAVMYLGKIVELADAQQIYRDPRHPYTQALLSAVPEPDPKHTRTKQRIVLAGEVPSPIDPPSGCAFHPRCPLSAGLASSADPADTAPLKLADQDLRILRQCVEKTPPLRELPGRPGHLAACHFVDAGVGDASEPSEAGTCLS
jgi:oligopeptide/dipeptide ABC transporter ATP-binding protein